MLPVLKPAVGLVEQLGGRAEVVGHDWLSGKTVWENPMSPTGSSAAVAVMISPSPWLKSVVTLVCRCSKASTLLADDAWPACGVDIGWVRP